MVLDDVTFARQVVEGKVSSVELTAIGGYALATAGTKVTSENSKVGLRVMRGPDWTGTDDGGNGNMGTLTRPTDTDNDAWYVRWDSTGIEGGYYYTGRRCTIPYQLAVPVLHGSASAFAWKDVTSAPTVHVAYAGGASDSLALVGNAEERVAKMSAWLSQNGFKASAAKDYCDTSTDYWTRKLVFTRADVPF
jgi:hypothetical protein